MGGWQGGIPKSSLVKCQMRNAGGGGAFGLDGALPGARNGRSGFDRGDGRRCFAASARWFALAGFSMGGCVALEIVGRAPRRVGRLALLDTNAGGILPPVRRHYEQSIAQIESGGLDEYLLDAFPRYVATRHDRDEKLRDAFVAMGKRVGAAAGMRQMRGLRSPLMTKWRGRFRGQGLRLFRTPGISRRWNSRLPWQRFWRVGYEAMTATDRHGSVRNFCTLPSKRAGGQIWDGD
jgi:pimeloyl-ACP methyl ester carboxylesterase